MERGLEGIRVRHGLVKNLFAGQNGGSKMGREDVSIFVKVRTTDMTITWESSHSAKIEGGSIRVECSGLHWDVHALKKGGEAV